MAMRQETISRALKIKDLIAQGMSANRALKQEKMSDTTYRQWLSLNKKQVKAAKKSASPTFVDLPMAETSHGQIAVVICQTPAQIAEILRGLK